MATAAKVALSSMSATAVVNLSVGPPYDLGIYRAGTHELQHIRIDGDSPFLERLSRVWSEHTHAAVDALPEVEPGDIKVLDSDAPPA